MCRFKSGLILKDRVFVPDYDSHEDMIKELGLKDDGNPDFVRAELTPRDDDPFSEVSKWKLIIDQDILPDWFVRKIDGKRFAKAVAEWANKHIIDGKTIDELNNGFWLIKNCKINCIRGDATVNCIGGDATVNYIRGNATVKYVCGNATVKYVCGNAIVKNVYGNATVNHICGNATVKYVYGDATVNEIYGHATVATYKPLPDTALDERAIIIDRNDYVIYHGKNWSVKEK